MDGFKTGSSRLSDDLTSDGIKLLCDFNAAGPNSRGAASQQRSPCSSQSEDVSPPGRADGRSGSIPCNPRHIPEEMNAGVACGGGKSLPAAVSVSPGLSLICLFTEDPPAGHFLYPLSPVSPHVPPPTGSAIDHPLYLC